MTKRDLLEICSASVKCEYRLLVGYVIAVYEECLQLPLLFFFSLFRFDEMVMDTVIGLSINYFGH